VKLDLSPVEPEYPDDAAYPFGTRNLFFNLCHPSPSFS
jgi:hypothetical protein